ncbi:MAG: hypothetical protein ABUK01_07685 [Leptospirales bacterium]
MSLQSEQIQTLNQIMGTIDQKAAQFKEERFNMREVQSEAQKKLLLELIQSALELAGNINPNPAEVIDDLTRLAKQISQMR